MAVAEIHSNQSDKSKENTKSKDKKERPSTKVVVRRLPPSMDQETFLLQVSPLPDFDYLYFVKGDMSLGKHAFARAYINFIYASDIFTFKEKFDNYVFLDHKGHEYAAVVEFATFQKIPRKRKPRQDPKSGTVESDPFYTEFLESLKAQPNQDEKPEFSYQFNTESKEQVVSTPLLDFVKQKRIDKQRIREERREQRKQREFERKKLREDDQRRRQEQRYAAKSTRSSKSLDTVTEVEPVEKKPEDETTDKDKKFYTNTTKSRFFSHTEKPDYFDKRSDFKKVGGKKDDYNREKEYRSRRFDDYKKENPRKTKKYSEKREERKNEVKKKLDDTLQESQSYNAPKQENEPLQNDSKRFYENQSSLELEDEYKDKSDDPRVQRRIRNKDRPSMAIYQPGMLSKRKVETSDGESASGVNKE